MGRVARWWMLLLVSLIPAGCAPARAPLILACTTSTQDTGILDVLLPAFTAKHHVLVKAIAVGSGEALAMGRRGEADVLLVHSPAAESEFMAEGHGELRLDVMYNDFVLVGPAGDPARIGGVDAVEALRRIAATGAPFVSRGDQSGTHQREQELWRKAGVAPAGKGWYVSTGQGMAETARIAAEKRAYTLIDRGTWLALSARLGLPVLCEGGADLRNSYRVIVVSPTLHPKVHAREARLFARWLVSPPAQKLIGQFRRAEFGRSLFVPDAR